MCGGGKEISPRLDGLGEESQNCSRYVPFLVVPNNVMLLIRCTTADKNLQPHLLIVCSALGALFEAPIDGDDDVSRAVRRSVLGLGELNFDKKVVDFTNNPHLAPIVKAGVKPVIWERKLKPAWRTVLNAIDNQGQQSLVDWHWCLLYFSGVCLIDKFLIWYRFLQRACA